MVPILKINRTYDRQMNKETDRWTGLTCLGVTQGHISATIQRNTTYCLVMHSVTLSHNISWNFQKSVIG